MTSTMPDLHALTLIPAERACLHEAHEPTRLAGTCRAIQAEGFLRHPILAYPMADGRFLILDGAHRTQALRELGCRRIPVQVAARSALTVDAWEHMVPAGPWLEPLRRDPALRWAPAGGASDPIAEVLDPEGTPGCVYPAGGGTGLLSRLPAWHRLVSAYAQHQSILRLPRGSRQRPDPGWVLFRYPSCRLQEVEEVAMAGQVMPPGVTRFIVAGRLLNLCIPLELLTAPAPAPAGWEELVQRWSRGLRYYAEGVYLCEA